MTLPTCGGNDLLKVINWYEAKLALSKRHRRNTAAVWLINDHF